MCLAVEEEIKLSKTDVSGTTLREHLQSHAQHTGKEADYEIFLPDGAEDLWRIFWELGLGRASNGFGYNPISYLEIKAYCDLMAEELTPWQILVLKQMDRVFLTETQNKGD